MNNKEFQENFNEYMNINLNTKAKDVFEFLLLNLSATQFIELYKIMTEWMEAVKNA